MTAMDCYELMRKESGCLGRWAQLLFLFCLCLLAGKLRQIKWASTGQPRKVSTKFGGFSTQFSDTPGTSDAQNGVNKKTVMVDAIARAPQISWSQSCTNLVS